MAALDGAARPAAQLRAPRQRSAPRAPRASRAAPPRVPRRGRACALSPVAATSAVTAAAPATAALCACAVAAAALEARYVWAKSVSSPLLAMGIAALLASAGLLPSASAAYDAVWGCVLPFALCCSVLDGGANVGVRAGATPAMRQTLVAFVAGALATLAGTAFAWALVGASLGPDGAGLAGALCASYVGGSVNFAATAAAARVGPEVIASAMAADNVLMAAFFGVLTAIPDDGAAKPAGGKGRPVAAAAAAEAFEPSEAGGMKSSRKATLVSVCTYSAVAMAACVGGVTIASALGERFASFGLAISAVLATSLGWAVRRAMPAGARASAFAGASEMGGALMLLFFAVIGAAASPAVAAKAGAPALAFICVLLGTHLGLTLAIGAAMGLPRRAVLVASNACVGGPATAAAMAAARGWSELARPAVAVGTLGYVCGTALGCAVAAALGAL